MWREMGTHATQKEVVRLLGGDVLYIAMLGALSVFGCIRSGQIEISQ